MTLPSSGSAASTRSVGYRYAQFCLVGASGLVVDMAVLHLLALWWGLEQRRPA